jgi:hypothetical protein
MNAFRKPTACPPTDKDELIEELEQQADQCRRVGLIYDADLAYRVIHRLVKDKAEIARLRKSLDSI